MIDTSQSITKPLERANVFEKHFVKVACDLQSSIKYSQNFLMFFSLHLI